MTETPPDHAQLASALRLSLLRAARRLRAQRVNTSATLSQLSALATICKSGPLSAGEIAAIERVQPPSMTKILASLEQAGWIERTSQPEDRRQSIIAITSAGRDLLAEETRARDEWLAKRLVEFSAEDLRTLGEAVEVLDKLGSE
ncbi:MAG: MarR family transcriptional regulator [Jatrophihabitantaceae bacterium]